MKRKQNKNEVDSESRYQQRLRKIQMREEEKELKDAIEETNKNIVHFNEIIQKKSKRELGRKITVASMEELIPIKRAVNRGLNGFEYRNKMGFFDIVKVVSFDFWSLDDDDVDMHVFYWDRYYRTTAIPLKRISLNMPVDTTQQINFLKRKLNQTVNPLYREKQKQEIKELRAKFEKRQTREYYLFFYAEDLDSLNNEFMHISASLEERGYIVRISPIKKLEVLNKFSNPYTHKEMITENFKKKSNE